MNDDDDVGRIISGKHIETIKEQREVGRVEIAVSPADSRGETSVPRVRIIELSSSSHYYSRIRRLNPYTTTNRIDRFASFLRGLRRIVCRTGKYRLVALLRDALLPLIILLTHEKQVPKASIYSMERGRLQLTLFVPYSESSPYYSLLR